MNDILKGEGYFKNFDCSKWTLAKKTNYLLFPNSSFSSMTLQKPDSPDLFQFDDGLTTVFEPTRPTHISFKCQVDAKYLDPQQTQSEGCDLRLYFVSYNSSQQCVNNVLSDVNST